MGLNCGSMRAHDAMGTTVNVIYGDVKRAADANEKTIDETLDTLMQTAAKDRSDHPAEYLVSP